ncbi:hypothetical protein ES703_66024 [subsurface metagenome]
MKTVLKFLNDNHQYLIGAIVIAAVMFWTYGCQSQVSSMLHPERKITRAGLQLELDYLVGQLEIKFADLDKQDEIKQTLLDLGSTFATSGTLNPTGLLNTAISVAAISFGLNQRKRRLNGT